MHKSVNPDVDTWDSFQLTLLEDHPRERVLLRILVILDGFGNHLNIMESATT